MCKLGPSHDRVGGKLIASGFSGSGRLGLPLSRGLGLPLSRMRTFFRLGPAWLTSLSSASHSIFMSAPKRSTLRGSALLAELTVNRTLPRPLTEHERLGREQRHAAALLYQLPIALPSREEPAGGERADVGQGTEVLVGNVNDYSRWLHLGRMGGQLEQCLSEP